MADDDKEKSANQLLQALDALSQLNQARANRRTTTSLALPRSGSGKDGDDALAVDAAVKEARPRIRRRSSLTSPPSWSKPKQLGKNGKYDDEELEGDDGALIIIIKSKGSSADAARPQPRRRFSLMLPYESRPSKLDKREDYDDDDEDDEEEDDDWAYSAPLKSHQGFATATPEAEVMSWDPNRARSHVGMRRIGCLFSMDVVAALGLPPSMDGLRLAVTVRRKEMRDGAAQTKPARVQLGAAYFDETLYVRCHLYGTGEPRPFLLSLVAIDAPELDLGRSTVDLSLFAKEFTDTCVRQWDMVFPLAGKAKGGELVVKLAIQSIDSQPAGEDKMSSKIRRRRNMLAPKTSRTKTSKLDEEPEPTATDKITEAQQEEPEREPADEPSSAVAEVKEEEQQKEPERESTPVAELEEVEQKESECEPADQPTSVAEMKEEEQQKEPESEPADEPTPVTEVMEEEQQKELELEPTDEPIPVAQVEEEEQQEQESEPADEPAAPVALVTEEEQQKEPESEPADDTTTPVAEVVEEEQQCEPEVDAIDEDVEGKQVNAEPAKEEAEARNGSEEEASLVAVDEVAKAVANGLEEKFVEETIIPVDLSDAVCDDAMEPVVANSTQLEDVIRESLQVPEQGHKGAADHALEELVDANKSAQPEEVTGESLHLPAQEGKGAAAKPPRRPRFKWRTVAVLVPVAVLFNKTLGVNR